MPMPAEQVLSTGAQGSVNKFAHGFIVEARDIDVMGHVNNVVYVQWIQDVAVKHWMAKASVEQIASVLWVVVRHEIDYLRLAFLGDTLTAHTWVGAATAATYERFTEIVRPDDDRIIVRARSVWCPVNAETKRPRRVDAAMRARFE
ncbi:MAG: acyl-CoA thioesterase [Pyrinomonadaceae bacterium MAG19_C2-C3]|nr:acyl-CoA thioesterase [Pyrinomonadaceae bacterium MAG19_C2-C3]